MDCWFRSTESNNQFNYDFFGYQSSTKYSYFKLQYIQLANWFCHLPFCHCFRHLCSNFNHQQVKLNNFKWFRIFSFFSVRNIGKHIDEYFSNVWLAKNHQLAHYSSQNSNENYNWKLMDCFYIDYYIIKIMKNNYFNMYKKLDLQNSAGCKYISP